MARSRNPGEPVVVLLAVLGIRIVEVPAIINLTTAGSRAWRPANVSPRVKGVDTYVLDHAR